MRLILLAFILLSTVACVGTGARSPLPLTGTQNGLSGVGKDEAKLDTQVSSLLISREAGSFQLSSLFLTEYLKEKSLPALQFYNNDEIIGEISPDDQAEFILITDAKDLNVTDLQIAAGELNGISIESSKIAVDQIWVLEKKSSTASYKVVFKITSYIAGKSLKLTYKVKEFKYL